MSDPAIPMRRATPGDVPALRAVQQAAFAWNRAVLGVEPLPLLADYDEVVATKECWLAEDDGQVGARSFWSRRARPCWCGVSRSRRSSRARNWAGA